MWPSEFRLIVDLDGFREGLSAELDYVHGRRRFSGLGHHSVRALACRRRTATRPNPAAVCTGIVLP